MNKLRAALVNKIEKVLLARLARTRLERWALLLWRNKINSEIKDEQFRNGGKLNGVRKAITLLWCLAGCQSSAFIDIDTIGHGNE